MDLSFTNRKARLLVAASSAALLFGVAGACSMPTSTAWAESLSSVYLTSAEPYAGSLYLVTYNRAVADGFKVQLNGTDMTQNRSGAWVALLSSDEVAELTNKSFTLAASDGTSGDSTLLGDANADGTVSIVDAQIAYDLAAGAYATTDLFQKSQLLTADVNADRVLNALDARAIQGYVHNGTWDSVEAFIPDEDEGDEEEAENVEQALEFVDAALVNPETSGTTSIANVGTTSSETNVYLVSIGDAPSKKTETDAYEISKKNKVTITSGGIYYLINQSDEAATGRIEVEVADSDASVTLIMGGLDLASSDEDGVVTVINDNDASVKVILREGTTNTLADTAEITTKTDEETSTTKTVYPDGALVAKKGNDLAISGSGTLNCSSTYGTGVKCTSLYDETTGVTTGGNLTITDATVNVTSAGNNGISAKAGLTLKNCTIDVSNVNGDGIKTTTPDNETDTTLGNITAKNATLTVSGYEDGIQAYRDATFTKCKVTVTTANDTAHATTVDGETKDSWKGVKSDGNMTITGGTWTIDAADKAIKSGASSDDTTATEAATTLTINGGTYNLTSTDDTVHSNGDIVINESTSGLDMSLNARDDAIHSDYTLTVNGGNITVTKCYEGLEAADLVVNDGVIWVTSSDDGFNAAGGNNSQSQGGDQFRPGPGGSGGTSTASNYSLTINGGTITLFPSGDGLDSNGDLTITGGSIYVNGPNSSGNGCFDYGDSNATFKITGGTLVAFGSGDMAVYPSTAGQAYVAGSLNNSYASGATVEIKDTNSSSAAPLVSYTAGCSFKYVMISSESMTSGSTYYLYVNGSCVGSLTATTSGSGSGGGQGGGDNPGGGGQGGGDNPSGGGHPGGRF